MRWKIHKIMVGAGLRHVATRGGLRHEFRGVRLPKWLSGVAGWLLKKKVV